MAKRQEQGDTWVRYTALLPPAYVERLRLLAAAAGLSTNEVRYRALSSLHEPDAEAVSDEPAVRYYSAEYDSFATWERLHAAMDQVVEHAFRETSGHDTHSAA